MTRKIKDLIKKLSNSENPNETRLHLKNSDLKDIDLKPFRHFNKAKYTRNLIHQTDKFELMTICWMPNHETPIHDHNGSLGYMLVLEGSVKEIIYKKIPGSTSLATVAEEKINAGEITFIDDTVGYHKIINLSKAPSMSLHFYAKPIESFHVYNKDNLNRFKKNTNFYSRFGNIVPSTTL